MFLITGVVHWIAGLAVFFMIPPDRPEPAERRAFSLIKPVRNVFRSARLRLMAAIRLLIDSTGALFFPLLPLFCQQVIGSARPDTARIGFVYSITGLATVLGAALIGRLGDRTNHKWTLTSCVLACALLFISHALLANFTQLTVVRFLTGFFSAGILPSVMAIVVIHTPMSERGVTIASLNSVSSLGGAFATFAGGMLVNAIGFHSLFYIIAASYFAAWVLAVVLIRREDTFATIAPQAAAPE
jgi:MFS family permease